MHPRRSPLKIIEIVGKFGGIAIDAKLCATLTHWFERVDQYMATLVRRQGADVSESYSSGLRNFPDLIPIANQIDSISGLGDQATVHSVADQHFGHYPRRGYNTAQCIEPGDIKTLALSHGSNVIKKWIFWKYATDGEFHNYIHQSIRNEPQNACNSFSARERRNVPYTIPAVSTRPPTHPTIAQKQLTCWAHRPEISWRIISRYCRRTGDVDQAGPKTTEKKKKKN